MSMYHNGFVEYHNSLPEELRKAYWDKIYNSDPFGAMQLIKDYDDNFFFSLREDKFIETHESAEKYIFSKTNKELGKDYFIIAGTIHPYLTKGVQSETDWPGYIIKTKNREGYFTKEESIQKQVESIINFLNKIE